MDLFSVLRSCKLFQELTDQEIREELLPRGILRDFSKGAAVITPHEMVNQFGIIVQGCVHIQQIFINGEVSLMLKLPVSHVLGLDLICTQNRQAPYWAVTAEATQIFFFSIDLLQPGSLRKELRLILLHRLVTMIANENMCKYYRLAILSQRGLRDRIFMYLYMQAGRKHSTSFCIPFSREEMAEFLCVNRSALSHELSQMKREGLIQFRKNYFTLIHTDQTPDAIWPVEEEL